METNYKRQYRQIDDTTKQKISQALRGRTKSATHVPVSYTHLDRSKLVGRPQ